AREQARAVRPLQHHRVADAAAELARCHRPMAEAARELETLKGRPLGRLPEFDAAIIDAHRMMLEDRGFTGKIESHIKSGVTAEAGLKRVVDEYLDRFAEMRDDYLSERAADVKDVGLRLLRNLLGVEEPERTLQRDSVLVAEEITLSDLGLIDHEHLNGIVLMTGGVTSHASILAKSFEIPTVVGAQPIAAEEVHEGDHLLVDGNSGVVFVNPPADVVREYDRL